ncbi:carboxylesterase family protein, partial [Kibdelosporangium lantanae]
MMRKRTSVGLLAGMLALSTVSATAALADTGHQAPVARVETGVLRGGGSGGVDSFLGVPYAAPPVG